MYHAVLPHPMLCCAVLCCARCQQDDLLGTVARLPPEFQFLGKNSKFKAGGRTFKSFKLCVRALGPAGANGATTVLAQVDSDTFKVRRGGCARLNQAGEQQGR
jgi:hypothetical protein